ncbi:helix-turn-helix domain-containing protein [Paenibacillus polymyxa]|jgi:transcriptional regulator with XRE-family HTH domain|uniref:Transcriptional regulator n=1 Tax=Paenibacillus polymyxa TaxID=1406 RepID=A0A0F0GDA7_PAEPO|nr:MULTISPECIES: helix-turn-helix transcriptional regulator [Paenibacillus]AHM64760.1 transcription factor,eukaryotic mbf1 [Paenibacillus polymyxa SQR-21]AIY10376.1 transcriptional regulator [Paenibacillus polymyxa]AUS25336.1 transcriptional regulator [Paenibacillus polymyxa]KAE8561296.1 transcriptional regulator [Paenibacillus polymyxa]KAF6584818.1 helix-turn-helix transcriptional regulator [Paenibacillus sp. EKM211P]
MSELLELVGTRIRDIRKSKGLSQEALAEKAGFNSSYIGFIERAERNISLKNLEKIAKALNVGVYQLLTYVKENDELTEEDSSIKAILSLLRTRETKDTELALKILTDIFIRMDER